MEMREPHAGRNALPPTALDLIYAGASGFIIGFCLAAGIGIILAYAIKAIEGIDGE